MTFFPCRWPEMFTELCFLQSYSDILREELVDRRVGQVVEIIPQAHTEWVRDTGACDEEWSKGIQLGLD